MRPVAQGQHSEGLFHGPLRLTSIEESFSRADCTVVRQLMFLVKMHKDSAREPRIPAGTHTNREVPICGSVAAD